MTSVNKASRNEVKTFSQAEKSKHSYYVRAEIELCKTFSALSPKKIVNILNNCSELVLNNKISLNWLLRCILYFSTIRPKEIKSYAELFTVLSTIAGGTCDFDIQRIYKTFANHLYKNGYISVDKFSSLRNKQENKEIIDIIISDNKELLKKMSLCPDFGFEMKLPIIIENEEKKLSLLQSCSFFGSFECFNFCLINGVLAGENDKIYAIMGGNINIVQVLNQNGIVFDNCFEKAIQYHRYALCDWLIIHNQCNKVKLINCLEYYNYPAFLNFLQNGSEINVKADGMTPLHFACQSNSLGIAKLLIKSGADIHAKAYDDGYKTPLHLACQSNSLGIAKLLIENGADINAKAYRDGRPPHGPGRHRRYFFSPGPDSPPRPPPRNQRDGPRGGFPSFGNSPHYYGPGPDDFEYEYDEPLPPDMTPLHFACESGSIKIAKLLIKNGANIYAKADVGKPIDIAKSRKHYDIVTYLTKNLNK